MNSGRNLDMTQGKPLGIVLRFAVPIFLSVILQNVYNLIDTAIAGNFLGDHALAAIGATGALYNLLISLATGMNSGFALLISRAFGNKREEEIRKAFTWTLLLNSAIAVVLTAGTLILLRVLMQAMNIPAEILDDARTYLLIIAMGIPVTMAYNIGGAVLNNIGNSLTPLLILLASSILNIILNLTLVTIIPLGIAGLAIATVTAQLFAALLSFGYIVRSYPYLRFERKHIRTGAGYVREMFLTGLSMGMVGTLTSFGSALMQAAVNSLGSFYIAAQISASRVQFLFMGMVASLSMAFATFASQNYGAGKRRRILEGMNATFRICAVTCVACILFAVTPLAAWFLRMITGTADEKVIQAGKLYILVSCLASPFLCILLTLKSALQGMRHKVIPLVGSAVELAGKVLFALALVPRLGYPAVCFCEPVLWAVTDLYLIPALLYYRREFAE